MLFRSQHAARTCVRWLSVGLATGHAAVLSGCTLLDFEALGRDQSAVNGPGVCSGDTYDADMDSSTPCVPIPECDPETYDHDESPFTACIDYTICIPGQYVGAVPLARADRQCLNCVTGTYTNTNNASACTFWSRCQPGEKVLREGSLLTNRECEPCPEGTFSRDLDTVECSPHSECPGSLMVAVEPTAMSDRVCSACGPGQFSDEGLCTPFSECAEDEYESAAPTATSDRVCAPTTTCLAGSFVDALPTSTSDRQCEPCPEGTYSNTENAATCIPWTNCLDNEAVASAPSAMEDRSCNACAAEMFSTGPNAAECVIPPSIQFQANRTGAWIIVVNGFLNASGTASGPDTVFQKIRDAQTLGIAGTDVFKLRHLQSGMFVARETPNPNGMDWLLANKTQGEAEIFDLFDCGGGSDGDVCGTECYGLSARTDDENQVVQTTIDARGDDPMLLQANNGSCVDSGSSWERFRVVQ